MGTKDFHHLLKCFTVDAAPAFESTLFKAFELLVGDDSCLLDLLVLTLIS